MASAPYEHAQAFGENRQPQADYDTADGTRTMSNGRGIPDYGAASHGASAQVMQICVEVVHNFALTCIFASVSACVLDGDLIELANL